MQLQLHIRAGNLVVLFFPSCSLSTPTCPSLILPVRILQAQNELPWFPSFPLTWIVFIQPGRVDLPPYERSTRPRQTSLCPQNRGAGWLVFRFCSIYLAADALWTMPAFRRESASPAARCPRRFENPDGRITGYGFTENSCL